jgi:hypothetical protein
MPGSPVRICTTVTNLLVVGAQNLPILANSCPYVCQLKSLHSGEPPAQAGKHAWRRRWRSPLQKLVDLLGEFNHQVQHLGNI